MGVRFCYTRSMATTFKITGIHPLTMQVCIYEECDGAREAKHRLTQLANKYPVYTFTMRKA